MTPKRGPKGQFSGSTDLKKKAKSKGKLFEDLVGKANVSKEPVTILRTIADVKIPVTEQELQGALSDLIASKLNLLPELESHDSYDLAETAKHFILDKGIETVKNEDGELVEYYWLGVKLTEGPEDED